MDIKTSICSIVLMFKPYAINQVLSFVLMRNILLLKKKQLRELAFAELKSHLKEKQEKMVTVELNETVIH